MIASILFTSCEKDEFKASYHVSCVDCIVSYWKADLQFEARIKAGSNFHFDFDANEGQKLQISALDTNDNSTIIAEIRLNGEIVASKESTGTTNTAAFAEYIIPRSRK